MPSFLPKIKDPRPGPAKIVYAPHIYPLLIHEDIPYGAVDRRSVSRWSINRTMEIKRLGGVPLIAGEIGGNDEVHGFSVLFFLMNREHEKKRGKKRKNQ